MERLPHCLAALVLALAGCNGMVGEPGSWPEGVEPVGPFVDDVVPPVVDPITCEVESIGDTPMRRLAQDQYVNAVEDLLGVRPSVDALPQDVRAGAFASNHAGNANESHVDAYLLLAEQSVAEALALPSWTPCSVAAAGTRECATEFIADFGQRAFRRPLLADEREDYATLFDLAETFEEGIALVSAAMLQAPQFLYVIEGDYEAEVGRRVDVGPYELATRLALFLWRSIPDDILLAAAAAGELETDEEISAQVRRMLRTERATTMITEFHFDWLGLNGNSHVTTLDLVAKEDPAFDGLRDSLRAETETFVQHLFSEEGDGRLETLLTANYSFLNRELGAFYGVSVDSDELVRTNLDPTQRAGILTQGSVLAVHGKGAQSAPIQRGLLIRELILCQPLAAPPGQIMADDPVPDPEVPRRDQFEEHRANPMCAQCHSVIDPLGFGFEHYDGRGVWRDDDGGQPVDASGSLSRADVEGDFVGVPELADLLGQSDDVRSCVTRQWTRFALGRLEVRADACSLARLGSFLEDSDGDLRELIVGIATSELMRTRAVSAPEAE